jgi:hypothetical protein
VVRRPSPALLRLGSLAAESARHSEVLARRASESARHPDDPARPASESAGHPDVLAWPNLTRPVATVAAAIGILACGPSWLTAQPAASSGTHADSTRPESAGGSSGGTQAADDEQTAESQPPGAAQAVGDEQTPERLPAGGAQGVGDQQTPEKQAPGSAEATAAVPDGADAGFRWLRFDLRGRFLGRGFSDEQEGVRSSEVEAEDARLELRWRPSRSLEAVLEGDAADDDHLKDAYLELRPSAFELRAGQFKPPVSPIEMISRWNLPAAERGLLSDVLGYCYGITGRRPGLQARWDPRGRGFSFGAGAFAASSVRGDRIGDEAFDDVVWDWSALKATARLAHASRNADLGVSFDLRPAEPVPGEGYQRFWTVSADATLGAGKRRGPRAWAEGHAGSSWQDANAFDGEDATFLAGRLLGAWRFGNDRRHALFLEPFAIVAVHDPDTAVREDLLWEVGGGLRAGALDHLRLVLEVQHREVSRNAPASLGLLPIGETAPQTRTRLIAQLGAAF